MREVGAAGRTDVVLWHVYLLATLWAGVDPASGSKRTLSDKTHSGGLEQLFMRDVLGVIRRVVSVVEHVVEKIVVKTRNFRHLNGSATAWASAGLPGILLFDPQRMSAWAVYFYGCMMASRRHIRSRIRCISARRKSLQDNAMARQQ
jgi:hypothetical protein